MSLLLTSGTVSFDLPKDIRGHKRRMLIFCEGFSKGRSMWN